MPQWVNPIWVFVGVVVFVSIVEISLKIDIKLDKTIDLEYYWQYPLVVHIVSFIKFSIGYAIQGIIISIVFLFIWNWIAKPSGFPVVPIPSIVSVKWQELHELETFWTLTYCIILFLAVSNIIKAAKMPIWQVFLSYRGQDVELVRSVADRLLGSGIEVWFAEYQIIPKTWEDFERKFRYGLTHSALGIAFTNDAYLDSEYCRMEMETLLGKAGSPVLEIALKPDPLPHDTYPQLKNKPRYGGCDLEGILSFIEAQTGWHINSSHGNATHQSGQETFETVCLMNPVSLGISDWYLTNEGEMDGTGCVSGATFEYAMTAEFEHLFVNLVCGPEYTQPGQRQNQSMSDREMFKSLIAFSRKYTEPAEKKKIRELLDNKELVERIPLQTRELLEHGLPRLPKYRVHGAHCLWFNGLSHFALTYYLYPCWMRKYSIVLYNNNLNRNAEFVFTFTYNGTFREFCLYGPVMDQFVRSLQWE